MSEHEDRLRQELRGTFENRALLYKELLDELRRTFPAPEAEGAMRRAIYRRGVDASGPLKPFAPSDIAGLARYVCAASADGGRLFNPRVLRQDDRSVDIHLTTCPLQETWRSRGLAEEEIALLCNVAAEFDRGKYEGAGFSIQCETWKPGRTGCCLLKIAVRNP
ncbi:MAG TPA: L-2-amino-thiazoline-4-carboxylic acid hydrolase [Thermodesulfobacteriota bacterium]